VIYFLLTAQHSLSQRKVKLDFVHILCILATCQGQVKFVEFVEFYLTAEKAKRNLKTWRQLLQQLYS